MNQPLPLFDAADSLAAADLLLLSKRRLLLLALLSGGLLTLSFAPFHLPGLGILALAICFHCLNPLSLKRALAFGFVFGLAHFSFGVSWVYLSIRDYGHIHPLLALSITALFILYLALFPAVFALGFTALRRRQSWCFASLAFSSLWIVMEWARSKLFGGFPWLLLAHGQVDSEFRHWLPLLGIYGTGFMTAYAACLLAGFFGQSKQRYWYLLAFALFSTAPALLQNLQWTKPAAKAIPVAVVQANVAMRDKWNEALFWSLLKHYKSKLTELLPQSQLVILPEYAIPIPPSYIPEIMDWMHRNAESHNSAILLGIPEPANEEANAYYNSMAGLGQAEGLYHKQHLVPFGEYIPTAFSPLIQALGMVMENLQAGGSGQKLLQVFQQPVASLICYELAYQELLRRQLPEAAFIVSISDDGWFGHSLAMYQQLQMARTLSISTGRYQIMANNDGLSSVIDAQGQLVESLPAFSQSVLKSEIYPMTGATLWVLCGDWPLLGLCLLILSILMGLKFKGSS